MARIQLSVRGVMIAVAVCGLVCWPLGIAVRYAIATTHQDRCSANLVAIGQAMHQYHGAYGHFPPAYVTDAAGKPAHTWRVLLLEFLYPALYRAYDFQEPWDGPHNSKLASQMPAVYACPNRHGPEHSSLSSYAVIVGDESAFPGSRAIKLSEIADGADHYPTILVIEAASLHVPWMEPRDVRVDQLGNYAREQLEHAGISSPDPTGVGVLCLDGYVYHPRTSALERLLRAMITISGNEQRPGCPY
jgi:hypothetical protein